MKFEAQEDLLMSSDGMYEVVVHGVRVSIHQSARKWSLCRLKMESNWHK